jgi:hypothetical protein
MKSGNLNLQETKGPSSPLKGLLYHSPVRQGFGLRIADTFKVIMGCIERNLTHEDCFKIHRKMFVYLILSYILFGDRGSIVVKVLRYKS